MPTSAAADELPDTLTAAAVALATGRTSARELTTALLERIERTQDTLAAFATVAADVALASADAADRERAAGRVRGPLHGIPVGLKDIIATADLPTHVGSVVLRDWLPRVDATLARRLRAAGAVIIGKLQTTEGASGAHHPSVRPPVNPAHPDAWTGVSSSGPGVVVAAGLCYGAFGSDTGGSIRFPSHCCGVVGLKPTYGRISRHGVYPLAETFDHVGPMARSVADVAALYAAVAGHDPADATTLTDPVLPRTPDAARVRGLRVGYDEALCGDGLDARIGDTLRAAVETLREGGARIVPVTVPPFGQTVEAWLRLCASQAVTAHRATWPARSADYGPALGAFLKFGSRVSAADLATANAEADAFRASYRALFETVDLVVSPSMPGFTPTAAEADARMRADGLMDLVACTAPANLTGHPALCLPAGHDARGFPWGYQLIGRRLGEAALLDAGTLLEARGPVLHGRERSV